MPTTERPVVTLLTFQVWDSDAGAWTDLHRYANEVTIKRGGQQSGASTAMQVGTLDATLYGPINLALQSALKPNSPIRVVKVDGGQPEFTGTIADLYQTIELDKSTNIKHVFTTVAAVDAVQSLANTPRSGVVSDSGVGYQSWPDRIRQLATSAQVPCDVPPSYVVVDYSYAGGTTDGWTGECSDPTVKVSTKVGTANGRPAIVARFVRGDGGSGYYPFVPFIRVGFINLDTRATYELTATVTILEATNATSGTMQMTYQGRVDNANGTGFEQSEPQQVATAVGNQVRMAVSFQPNASTGLLAFGAVRGVQTSFDRAGGVLSYGLSDITVSRVNDPQGYALRDVAFESDLATHFDLACNSVGARWWVTKDGTVRFRRELLDNRPALTFADTDAGDVSYTDVALSYDTRNLVNAITLNQHGRDPVTGNTADESRSYTAAGSINRYGPRASSLDTSLFEGTQTHALDLQRRASDVMTALSRPSYQVSSLEFNVQSNPKVLDGLDLRSLVRVLYDDLQQTCRVLAITHTITPTSWRVRVEFNEVAAGITFSDYRPQTAGQTFAQFNAAHAGQTFRAFNANP